MQDSEYFCAYRLFVYCIITPKGKFVNIFPKIFIYDINFYLLSANADSIGYAAKSDMLLVDGTAPSYGATRYIFPVKHHAAGRHIPGDKKGYTYN